LTAYNFTAKIIINQLSINTTILCLKEHINQKKEKEKKPMALEQGVDLKVVKGF